MADKLDSFEQVWNFLVQIDPSSASKLANDLRQLNEQRRSIMADTEKKITEDFLKETNNRMLAAESAVSDVKLDAKEKLLAETNALDELAKANEAHYANILKLAKDTTGQERELRMKLLTDEEQKSLQLHQKSKDQLNERKRELKPDTRGIETLGKAAGALTAGVPFSTSLVAGFDLLAGKMEPIKFLTTIVSDVYGLLKDGLADARRRDLQQIGVAAVSGRGFGFGQGGQIEQAAVQRRLEQSVQESQRGQAFSTMQRMVRGAPGLTQPGVDVGGEQFQEVFNRIINTADSIGISWDQAADTITKNSRRFNISIEEAANQMGTTNETFRRLVTEQHLNVSMADLRDMTDSAVDSLKEYNLQLPEATNLVGRFAKQLDSGQLSLSDLFQYISGQVKQDMGTQAFFIQQIMKEFGTTSEFARKAQTLTGGNMAAMQQLFAQVMGGEAPKELGMDPKRARQELMGLQQDLMGRQADRMVGPTEGMTPFAIKAQREMALTQLEESQLGARAGRTLAAKQAMRGGMGPGAVDAMDRVADRAAPDVKEAQRAAQTMRENSRSTLDELRSVFTNGTGSLLEGLKQQSQEHQTKLLENAARERAAGNDFKAAVSEFRAAVQGTVYGKPVGVHSAASASNSNMPGR